MWALEQPWAPPAGRRCTDTPAALLALLAGTVLAGAVLVAYGGLPPAALAVLGVAAGHGALLATALAWAGGGRAGAGLVAIALLALAALAARHPAGALAYAGPPLWIAWLARRGRLRALGLGAPPPPRAWLAGLLLGLFLGGHLLVSASLALGVRVGVPLATLLAGVAYDAGANVLAAECFFRGALFGRAQRRWSFGTAAALSTAASVLRYLVDPLLPKQVELIVGATFYLTLLGLGNCWLLRWSGSLLPGGVAALCFFAAYRLLGSG